MAVVGSATVTIRADTSKLLSDVERQLSGLSPLGDKIGKALGDNIKKGLADGMGDSDKLFDDLVNKSKSKGGEAGKGFSDSFKGNLDIGGAIDKQIDAAGQKGQKSLSDHVATGIANGANRGGASAGGGMGRHGTRGGNNYGMNFQKAFERHMKRRTPAPFEASIKGMAKNLVPLQFMQGALVSAGAAVSSLISGFFALGTAIASAIPAAFALGNALMAVAQGGIVLKAIFGGIGKGIQAYTKSLKATEKTDKKKKEDQLSEAERLLRIKEARLALADAIMDGARRNADAIERVTDAQEDYEDSLERVADAEEGVRDAMREEKKALDDINKAREEARERLEDLALELDRASLNEERAALNLREAEEELARARAGGNARAIEEADLAYREQVQSVRELAERNQDLRQEANEAQAAGVDGAEGVLDAQENYRDAIEATRDAHEELADAIEGVEDAQRELNRAIEDVPRVAADVAMSIARAQLALERALLKSSDAAEDASKSMDDLNDAFSKLSPAAQRFVRFIVNKFLPEMDRIKKIGQEAFFPKLQEGLQNVLDSEGAISLLEDTVRGTSEALGIMARDLINAFIAPKNLTNFRTIIEGNIEILKSFGRAATNLVQPIGQIFAATTPMAKRWATSVENATAKFRDWIDEQNQAPPGEESPMAKFFAAAEEKAKQLWRVIKNVGKGLKEMFTSAMPAGNIFLDGLEKMSAAWAEKMQQPETKKMMEEAFKVGAENALKLLDILGDVIGIFFKMGADPNIGLLLDAIAAAIPVFDILAEDALGAVLPLIIDIVEAMPEFATFFAETGTIQVFANILGFVVDALALLLKGLTFLNNMTGGWFLKAAGYVMGTFLALKLFTGLAGSAIQKVVGIKDSVVDMGKAFGNAIGKMANFFKKFNAGRKASKGAKQTAEEQGWGDNKKLVKQDAKAAKKEARAAVQEDFDKKHPKKGKGATGEVDELGDEAKRAAAGQEDGLRAAGNQMGDNLISGFITGLNEGIPKVREAVADVGKAAVDGLGDSIDAHSDSVKAKERGRWFWQGFVGGVREGQDDARTAGDAVGDAAVDGLEGGEAEARKEGSDIGEAYADGAKKEKTSVKTASESLNDAAISGLNGGTAAAKNAGERQVDAYKGAWRGEHVDSPEIASNPAEIKREGEQDVNTYKSAWVGETVKAPKVVGGGMGASAGLGGAAGGMDDVGKGAGKAAGKLGKFAKFGKVLLGFLGPIGMVIGAIFTVIEVLQMLGISFDDIINFFKNFGENIGKVGEWFGNIGESIGNFVSELWPKITGALGELVGKVVNWFKDNWVKALMMLNPLGWLLLLIDHFFPDLKTKLGEMVKKVVDWFKNNWVKALMMLSPFGWIALAINKFFPDLKTKLGEFVGKVVNWFKTNWKSALMKLSPFGWIITAITKIWPEIKEKLQWLIDKIKGWIGQLSKGIWDAMPGGLQDVFINVTKWINKYVIDNLQKIPFLKNVIKDLPVPKKSKGKAEGGFITGPDMGPKADNVLVPMTPGEFVASRKMVEQVGAGPLATWQRTGRVPFSGGTSVGGIGKSSSSDDLSKGGLGEWWSNIKEAGADLLGQGAKWLIEKLLNNLPKGDNIIMEGVREWMLTLTKTIVKWAQNHEPSDESGTAVPAYNGPPGGWTYPLGRRFTAKTYKGHKNPGSYDIATGGQIGIKVFAVSAGQIYQSVNKGNKSYGQYLAISHAKGEKSLYAHLSQRIAKLNQIVKTGELIGKSGNTGRSTGPHLHFELNQPKDARAQMAKHGVKLAEGGVIRATTGGLLALLAEGGRSERVTPLDSQGRSATEVEMLEVLRQMATNRAGDTFQVFPAPGMNERELAVKVSREVAFQHRRRS